ncbi:carbon storage regulator [Legionella israelensis]|uniref:Translational regulator CsrA n=1 Tax=Legionella israelensis TaxID=454 RepID=A0A0W0V2S0_9GAMM|nr:carbon storage regulator [Legionella israelensis]KTD14373.1 carbon storage regulator [Legionella israelensis]QBS09798.1 carbon storage regulator [Legionella israelensis]SCY10926.1 carbon storage regulator, CsrA [Legionella israelensis DSM 19235]STX59347.1 Carbon storage regulator [Legionella israelensis]
MLVLTRRIGESVVIHDDVYCTVLDYQNGEVRLAFDAPISIPVHRDEIQRRIYRDRIRDNWFIDKTPNKESIVDRLINKFKSSAA